MWLICCSRQWALFLAYHAAHSGARRAGLSCTLADGCRQVKSVWGYRVKTVRMLRLPLKSPGPPCLVRKTLAVQLTRLRGSGSNYLTAHSPTELKGHGVQGENASCSCKEVEFQPKLLLRRKEIIQIMLIFLCCGGITSHPFLHRWRIFLYEFSAAASGWVVIRMPVRDGRRSGDACWPVREMWQRLMRGTNRREWPAALNHSGGRRGGTQGAVLPLCHLSLSLSPAPSLMFPPVFQNLCSVLSPRSPLFFPQALSGSRHCSWIYFNPFGHTGILKDNLSRRLFQGPM